MPSTTRLKWAVLGWCASFIATMVVVLIAAALLQILGNPGQSSSGLLLGDLSLGWQVLLQVPLWAGLLGVPLLARRAGLLWREQLGWQMRSVDIALGVGAGLLMQFVLVPLLYLPIFYVFGDLDVEGPAREMTESANSAFDVAVLVAMTVIAAPLTEELFFRGLLQGALRDRLNSLWALLIASAAFAVVHFQVIQFPALMLVGVVNGVLVMRTGRLGAALWAHASFNAVTVVVLMA